MKLSDNELETLYKQIDLDPNGSLQQATYRRLRVRPVRRWRRVVWAACAAAVLALCAVPVWKAVHRPEEIPVLPTPQWLAEQADFSMYLSANGEFLVPSPRREI